MAVVGEIENWNERFGVVLRGGGWIGGLVGLVGREGGWGLQERVSTIRGCRR